MPVRFSPFSQAYQLRRYATPFSGVGSVGSIIERRA